MQATYDELMQYDVFFFRGGDQWKYYSLYKDTKTVQAIEVYPNPKTGKIRFQNLDENQKYIFQLFDLQDKTLKSEPLNGRQEIDLQGISLGVYYFNLLEVDGRNLYIGKVLKQN